MRKRPLSRDTDPCVRPQSKADNLPAKQGSLVTTATAGFFEEFAEVVGVEAAGDEDGCVSQFPPPGCSWRKLDLTPGEGIGLGAGIGCVLLQVLYEGFVAFEGDGVELFEVFGVRADDGSLLSQG